jgi:hypothetical protein
VAEAPAVGRSPANDVSRNATAVKQRPALSDYANYLLRYKLGAVVPKSSRPQTLVVVARARPA